MVQAPVAELNLGEARFWTVWRSHKEPSVPSLARSQCEVAACRSSFPFRLFELEEINAPTSVAGNHFVIVDEGTGIRRTITSKTPSTKRSGATSRDHARAWEQNLANTRQNHTLRLPRPKTSQREEERIASTLTTVTEEHRTLLTNGSTKIHLT